MRQKRAFYLGVAAVAVTALWGLPSTPASAQQAGAAAVTVGAADIGGVVRSANGPEAGVWVIAQTSDLPTKYVKIVVTDDQGRYLLPDLPKANYEIWVRGYGLVDSEKVKSAPGKTLDLTAVVAPNAAAAAEYYPAQYWYSMLHIPDKSLFPGTGPSGNGMSANVKSQGQWLAQIKTFACNSCHQLGNKPTRTFSPALGTFNSSYDAWFHRVQVGPAAEIMVRDLGQIDTERALRNFADWTDRIGKGELPKAKPQRPAGIERNVVITMWDWGDAKTYLHDEIASDKRHPTVNAYGKIYSATEDSTDNLPILDPQANSVSYLKMAPRDPKTPSGVFIASGNFPRLPSPYWGEEMIWHSQTSVHNPMFDQEGRVWMTARIRPPQTPAFCRKGSDQPSAKLFPMDTAARQAAMYDPRTQKISYIDTCFGTHHLIFAEDADNTLWFSGGGARAPVVGWVNTKKFLETGDAAASQGWTAMILDTNGNGKRDEGYVEPNQPVDPTKDKRIVAGLYGIGYDHNDGTIWGSVLAFPGGVVHIIPGANPPATTLSEYYEVPYDDRRVAVNGFGPRGMDIDRNGVVWVPLASGHMASFDRKKCKGPLNGPTATGRHCPEGWTLYQFPGPQFEGLNEPGAVQSSYYTWVDQFDTLGLGNNVPMATGNMSDSIEALVDGKFVTMRIPYPMGFHAKGMDGRIDDPNAGWKGRGVWSTYAGRAPYHIEGGKGTTSKVVHFQMRPDPLAR
ncbi:MAG TPA: carboxypeptidase-like regulatory domain-containing protein [Xanthobacteraceae bacterium]